VDFNELRDLLPEQDAEDLRLGVCRSTSVTWDEERREWVEDGSPEFWDENGPVAGIIGAFEAPVSYAIETKREGPWVISCFYAPRLGFRKRRLDKVRLAYVSAPGATPSYLADLKPDEFMARIWGGFNPYPKHILVPVVNAAGHRVAITDQHGRTVVKHQPRVNPRWLEARMWSTSAFFGHEVYVQAKDFIHFSRRGRELSEPLTEHARRRITKALLGPTFYED